jgi:hypothetical protein
MKSLLIRGILTASLALSANAALAGNAPVHHVAKAAHMTHARAPAHAAARRYYQPRAQLSGDIGQFIQSILAGRVPNYAALIRGAARARSSRGPSDWSSPSPTYDASLPIDTATNNAQALADQENRAIQSMNDTNAMVQSMQAAAEQNAEANAATLRTEINAGM